VARVATSPAKFFWDLSPDGSRIAYGQFDSRTDDHLTILTLNDRTTRVVPLAEWTTLNSLSWSADGTALFVTTSRREGSEILHATLDGKVDVLREDTGRWFANPRPSHDGRLLAFGVRTTDSNVWLIERK
jgi:Tol biopolymer transport system component